MYNYIIYVYIYIYCIWYPPGNDHISHLGKFGKSSSSKVPSNRGICDRSQESNQLFIWNLIWVKYDSKFTQELLPTDKFFVASFACGIHLSSQAEEHRNASLVDDDLAPTVVAMLLRTVDVYIYISKTCVI